MKKTIMVHIDGIPTHPLEQLGQQTVLQVAQLSQLDDLARTGEVGRFGVPKESRPFCGGLALMSILGYDPQKWYPGPGVFEAINLEVVLDRNDVAFLCDFVTLRAEDGWGDGKKLGPSLLMDEVCDTGIETEDARELIDAINEQLVSENIQFYFGHHGRHLMVWVGGNAKFGCGDPHQIIGRPIDTHLAAGDGAKILCELMEASRMILRHHPINQERVEAGLKPVNCLWLWGQSKTVELPVLQERWPIHGAVVSPSGPYRGIAMASGLQAKKVDESFDDEFDWFRTMVGTTSKILESKDMACLHIPCLSKANSEKATDASRLWVETMQDIDAHLIEPLRQNMDDSGAERLLVVVTPGIQGSKEGMSSPAPFVLYEKQSVEPVPENKGFTEIVASQQPVQNATTFLGRLFGKS